ncbi:hypothetical protein Tco_0265120 [Tanacetum coccineum]
MMSGLYALACEEDAHCLAILVKSFKLIEVYREHDVTALDSYIRPPRFRATIEDITDEPGSIATNRTKKMLLLTWSESSEPTKEPVCDYVTPSSLPQHDSSTPCKDSICESITPRCMPDCMLTPPSDESVITYTQTREPIMEDVIVEDYVSSGEDGEDAEHGIDTAYDLQFSEDVGTNDDDDEDDDFLVDEENEIIELDVDVHLFSISMDLPFDNIGVTNLVPDDVLEGEDVDVINVDGFDSDLSEDNEISNYRRRRKFTTAKEAKDRLYLHSIESRRNLKLYKNDSIRIRARCDGKVLVRVNPDIPVKVVQDQLQRDLEGQISMSKSFRVKAKAEREIRGDHIL